MSTRDNLTAQQNVILDEFITLFNNENLTQKQRQFCDESCFIRFLKARDFKLKKAFVMLKSALTWREQYKPDDICPSIFQLEASSGKLFRRGVDKDGAPVIYITPARENSTDYAKNMKLLIYTLESAIASMKPGVEQMVWVLDFNGYTTRNAPPLGICKETLSILSNYYPERLKAAIVVDPPKPFHLFYTLIRPLVPPVTKEKVHIAKGEKDKKLVMSKFFADMNEVEPRFGGTSGFDWNKEFSGIWQNEIETQVKRKEPCLTEL
jgi:hypothetical protein